MSAPLVLTVFRQFDAAPEVVFDAWLDAESVVQWLFATPSGVMETIEINPRVGGGFRIAERRGAMLATHFGTYLEIDRPHRLAFMFGVGADAPETRVSIALEPREGGCLLTLTHEGVWEDYAERTKSGWTMILDGLARALRVA